MRHYLKYLMILFVFTGSAKAQDNEQIWESEFNFGGNFVLTTFLKVNQSQNQFTITSPENADKRMFGNFKSKLGRATGKLPKKGIFITINGTIEGNDLVGVVNTPLLGDLTFEGVLEKDLLTGNLLKNDTLVIGNLKAIKSKKNQISYKHLHAKLIDLTESNIYSKDVLKTKSWKKFNKSLKRILNKAEDDIELFVGFNMISQNLGFSHYNLMLSGENTTIPEEEDNDTTQSKEVTFEEKNATTAYLKIDNFSSTQEELAKVLPKVVENKNYENLIIDLRNNGGGGIEAAFELAQHLISQSTNVGYFITKNLEYSGFDKKLFENLNEINPSTTDQFIEYLKNNTGAKLVFHETDTSVFKGNLYVLTNNNTASTCEPIVYILKNNLGATIIGEQTAGAMLSAAPFDIEEKYKLILPIADFYTSDGVRLDQNGVLPNVVIESEKALDKALEIINNNTIKNY
ncbi:S41 family peptidase [Olleya sp. YS]|uniref:S41 family peptidase n=1 Tax=Olleya sp. YS TaxID=3028318 RepID=UPI0024345356|nr:S41 family peptidase [Olleya sp. YS]WGD35643.1 S41 family peptidase [Olleya sp. YS]